MIKCGYCQQEIKEGEDKFMVAFEVPYLNIYVHRTCWLNVYNHPIDDYKKLLEIHNSNIEMGKKS